ncbi:MULTISPECIES: glyoxylate/hydroxypyruvate reductase A [unclassified Duganella]|uniref:2-hydroxyacid dehydrogenase n=1 Tax=unclassified Duganella TaxID=2636909 RepID=UPI0006F34F01|nr:MULTISPECIES: glyoxylate/hydroxypyruvate reductase A [unclassified Duganella]KQV43065.1 glyoxylate/hydroxypyruvate reductase A [Duganella sp. Root336D2]KRB97191.1 glyoxylate/hydroxypyruvate reductase A [Duganella sp. Root198D2]
MRILLYRADGNTAPWVKDFADLMPEAEVVVWREGAHLPTCDYAVLWTPPQAMLAELARVKAIFLTGAGADAIMKYSHAIPPHIPIVRLNDAGMGIQMAEYVTHAVLRYFRRLDEYETQARSGAWLQLEAREKADFSVGVMGVGALGSHVIEALRPFGFPLRAWSRSPKSLDGVDSFHGEAGLDGFLGSSRVVVCMLPLTEETTHILNRPNMMKMPQGSYIINVGRGAHISEPDLLPLIKSGHIAGATLDVFRNEPLPAQHPFWMEPRITITPHISALTLRRESVEQMAAKMRQHARGEEVADVINRTKGY